MFIYERNGSICVTFKANKPVDAPEYVITIDRKNETVYVNGKKFIDPVEEVVEEAQPVVEEVVKQSRKRTSKIEEPEVVAIVEETEAVAEEPTTTEE